MDINKITDINILRNELKDMLDIKNIDIISKDINIDILKEEIKRRMTKCKEGFIEQKIQFVQDEYYRIPEQDSHGIYVEINKDKTLYLDYEKAMRYFE